MNMRVRLVITTDGRPDLLERALDSFDTHVRPRPVETVVVDDSGDREYRRYLDDLLSTRMGVYGGRAKFVSHSNRQGFCDTVADAWALAGQESDHDPADTPEWVFWLEDDFVFERTVPLVDLGQVLHMQPQVAQMLLCRQPVSDEERDAGGFLKVDPERFSPRGSGTSTWIEHRAFWSTNPSLFKREIAVAHPWPVVDRCEGIFTRDLLIARPETTFGVWGDGSVWVKHAGDRVGRGY